MGRASAAYRSYETKFPTYRKIYFPSYLHSKGSNREDQEVGLRQELGEAVPFCSASTLACMHISFTCARRICEYDDDTLEYWVNVRTSGKLSREDLQSLSRSHTHEQEAAPEDFADDQFDFSTGGFPELGAADSKIALEGDSRLGVAR